MKNPSNSGPDFSSQSSLINKVREEMSLETPETLIRRIEIILESAQTEPIDVSNLTELILNSLSHSIKGDLKLAAAIVSRVRIFRTNNSQSKEKLMAYLRSVVNEHFRQKQNKE